MSRWRKWRRRLLWLAGGLAVALLLLWGVMAVLMMRWVAKPPVLAELPAITRLAPETRGDRVYLGRNWLGQREGLAVLYVTGTPFEMGYANGVLTQKMIHHQEDAVLQLLNRVAPYRWTQFVLEFWSPSRTATWSNTSRRNCRWKCSASYTAVRIRIPRWAPASTAS